MSRVTRRAFLGSAGLASAAIMAPRIVLPVLQPTWNRVPCSLCGVGCGLLAGIQGGRAVAVRGDPDSPVSQGSACARGYNSVEALAGRDRIRQAMVRRGGALVAVPLGQALDLVAQRIRETVARHGKDSVALYGSAAWSMADAYAAAKLFKGALGTNNVETASRLRAGSVMTGLRSTFGEDGAPGCYEDIDHADVIVLWDVNLAETDPVLFSRILERKRREPAVRIVSLSTRATRTSYAADQVLLYQPHATLAIAHGICQEIVERNRADHAFLDRHVAFKRGRTDFGGEDSGDRLALDQPADATWDDYTRFLWDYRPERVQELSGMQAADIRWLASLYDDPLRRVMSVWGRAVNQDIRGTWANNALYNIHLLVGKIARPGNAALGLCEEPNGGCAVHDAGSLTDALPRGTVRNEADRRRAARVWGVAPEVIDPQPGAPVLGMFRRLERGDIRLLWIQSTDPMTGLPDLDRYRRAAARADRFIVVSAAYPSATTDVADVVLPAALWFEREGLQANVERRIQYFDRLVAPPGDAAGDAWLTIEVARRLGFEKLFPYDAGGHVEQIWEEYRRFHDEAPDRLPPLSVLRSRPGVQWPYWPYPTDRGVQWRYSTAHDPAAQAGYGEYDFYGHPDHRAWIWLRPYEPPAEAPDSSYPFWLTTGAVLEHWDTGVLTQRIGALHRALPHAYVEVNRDDARRLGIRNREMVRLVSRRGSLTLEARIDYRSQPPAGHLFAPEFDESLTVKRLMLDAADPLSGEPDGSKCAVRVERMAAAPAP